VVVEKPVVVMPGQTVKEVIKEVAVLVEDVLVRQVVREVVIDVVEVKEVIKEVECPKDQPVVLLQEVVEIGEDVVIEILSEEPRSVDVERVITEEMIVLQR
jgi:hypothetical protein